MKCIIDNFEIWIYVTIVLIMCSNIWLRELTLLQNTSNFGRSVNNSIYSKRNLWGFVDSTAAYKIGINTNQWLARHSKRMLWKNKVSKYCGWGKFTNLRFILFVEKLTKNPLNCLLFDVFLFQIIWSNYLSKLYIKVYLWILLPMSNMKFIRYILIYHYYTDVRYNFVLAIIVFVKTKKTFWIMKRIKF